MAGRRRRRPLWLTVLLPLAAAVSALAMVVAADLARLPGQGVAEAQLAQWMGPERPVAFSHALHAGDLGMDCRACHGGAETGAQAGLPPMTTCGGCHYPGAGQPDLPPLVWPRTAALPDHTYFHHGVHVSAGLACADCHGPVETMARTIPPPDHRFSMRWCLDCHREAAQDGQRAVGLLTHCHACHR